MTNSRSPHLRFGLLVAAFAFILDQVTNGLAVRMAVLYLCSGKTHTPTPA